MKNLLTVRRFLCGLWGPFPIPESNFDKECICFQELIPDVGGDPIQPDEEEWLSKSKKRDRKQNQEYAINQCLDDKDGDGAEEEYWPGNGGKKNCTRIEIPFLWVVIRTFRIDAISTSRKRPKYQ